MDFTRGDGQKERSEAILKQWERERQHEINNRRDRQLGKDEYLCGAEEVKPEMVVSPQPKTFARRCCDFLSTIFSVITDKL